MPVARTSPIVARIVRTGTGRWASGLGIGAKSIDAVASRPAMGQSITVFERHGRDPYRVRYEINRSLTGMAHHRYTSPPDDTRQRPPDNLARKLFERDGVTTVHIYSNEIEVTFSPGSDTKGVPELIQELYIHYREGVTPSIP